MRYSIQWRRPQGPQAHSLWTEAKLDKNCKGNGWTEVTFLHGSDDREAQGALETWVNRYPEQLWKLEVHP